MIDSPLLRRKTGLDWGLVVGTVAIGASWLYLNRVALHWLSTLISEISIFNGVILAAGMLLIAVLGWRYRQSIELVPGLHQLPLLLLLSCGVATISTQWLVSLAQLPVGQLRAVGFVLGSSIMAAGFADRGGNRLFITVWGAV
jgi:hypothetical protein